MGMAAASDARLLEVCDLGTGNVVVVVVEPLDDLERPAALEHIATDQAPPQRRGFVSAPGPGKTSLFKGGDERRERSASRRAVLIS